MGFGLTDMLNPFIEGGFDWLAQEEQQRENSRARTSGDAQAAAQAAMQKEFAQNGIRWKVEDAVKAGLHPLAALGAQGASYTPVSTNFSSDSPRADFYSKTGQNISRAINSSMTPEEKAMKALTIESMQIDNAIKKKHLEGIDGPPLPSNSSLGRHLLGSNPLSVPSDAYVWEQPTQKSHASPGKPYQAAGEYTDYVFSRTSTGLHPVPSKEIQEAIEDKMIPETMWAMRNYLYPTFSSITRSRMQPSLREHPLPPGYIWRWKPSAAEFRPYKKGTRTSEFFFKGEN